MVDRHAVGVGGVEGHRLVAEVGAEALEHVGVRPVASRRVGHPGDVVEDHGAGALEEDPVGLQAGVVDDRLHAVLRLQHLQHIGASFVPTVGGIHRVDPDVPTRVGGQPVVGEHAVGAGVVLVGEDVDANARGAQGAGDGIHLGQGLGRRLLVGLPAGASVWAALSAAVAWLGRNRSARTRMTAEGAWALTIVKVAHGIMPLGPDLSGGCFND